MPSGAHEPESTLSCKSEWSGDLTRIDADGALTRAGAD